MHWTDVTMPMRLSRNLKLRHALCPTTHLDFAWNQEYKFGWASSKSDLKSGPNSPQIHLLCTPLLILLSYLTVLIWNNDMVLAIHDWLWGEVSAISGLYGKGSECVTPFYKVLYIRLILLGGRAFNLATTPFFCEQLQASSTNGRRCAQQNVERGRFKFPSWFELGGTLISSIVWVDW